MVAAEQDGAKKALWQADADKCAGIPGLRVILEKLEEGFGTVFPLNKGAFHVSTDFHGIRRNAAYPLKQCLRPNDNCAFGR